MSEPYRSFRINGGYATGSIEKTVLRGAVQNDDWIFADTYERRDRINRFASIFLPPGRSLQLLNV